jgi:hypothetical protein
MSVEKIPGSVCASSTLTRQNFIYVKAFIAGLFWYSPFRRMLIRIQCGIGFSLRVSTKEICLLSTKLKFRKNVILILSKFRWFNTMKFWCRNRNFDLLLSTDSKFPRKFGLISSKLRCFHFDIQIGLSILVLISTSEFQFWFRYRDFDSDIGTPKLVPEFDINFEISKHFSPK